MSTGTFTGIPPAPASSSSPNLALLILRVAVSLPVLYHGSAILFGAFGGPGPQNFAAFIRQPAVVGYLVGLAQLAGGIAILLGALQRIGSVCVILVMMGAIYLIHLPHGFDIGKGGYEFALTVLLVNLGLLISGPGAYSLSGILPGSLKKL
jgi:putative oxidoreductase